MAQLVAEKGAVLLTACYSKCEACNTVAAGMQFTGPSGYVMICSPCMAELQTQARETMQAQGGTIRV